MRRYQPPNPENALVDELQRIWDAIKRLREAGSRSMLPYGFEFDVTEDGDIRIVQNGAIVTISNGGSVDLTGVLTEDDIPTICEECGGGDTIIIDGDGVGLTANQRVVVASDTVDASDGVILCEHGGPITLSLDAGLTVANTIVVKDRLGAAGANPVSIAAPGGFSIDGAAAYALNVPYRAVTIGRESGGDFFII